VFPTRPVCAGQHRLSFPTFSLALVIVLSGCSGGGGPSPATTEQTTVPQNNPAPAISSISPSSALVGASSTTVTITGSGFVQGSTVEWNQSSRPTTFVSSTQLQVTVTSADLANAGTAQISVVNPSPGGGISGAAGFAIDNPAPIIASLSQTSTMAGSAATVVTITGTGFVSASVTQWNQSGRPTTFVSPTQLQVALTASDLALGEIAQITVMNSAPGGGTSPAATFTINNPVPQITGVSPTTVTTNSGGTVLTVLGSGFVQNSSITWNGANHTTKYISGTELQLTLQAGDLVSAGSAQIGVSNPPPTGGTSPTTQPLTIVNPPPFLLLSASPNPLLIYPNSTVTLQISAQTNITSVTPTVTLGQLPPGITTTTTFPLAIPAGGASINFHIDASVAVGSSFTLAISGKAGSASASVQVPAIVQTNPPTFFFTKGLFSEVGVPFGGSGQIQFTALPNGQADYDVQLTLSGLPPGTTATINPQIIPVGQSATVTISAASTAPESQNASVTLTGTPLAPAAGASISFLVDVTPKPGSLPNNRTDYISTEATPYAAVYDPLHRLIFASVDSWNRVDVISSVTHARVARIPLSEPRGIDITQDGSTVWVASGSRQIFAINTANLAVTRYLAPAQGPTNSPYWEGSQLMVLADGTMMIVLTPGKFAGVSGIAIWNPATNALTFPTAPTAVFTDAFYRSGDGKRVYFIASDSGGAAFYYDVTTKAFSSISHLAGFTSAAVNMDSSRIVASFVSGTNMYDGNFNLIGPVPGSGLGGPTSFKGSIFSADGRFLYEEVTGSIPLILKIDVSTLSLLSVAPAMPLIEVMPLSTPGPFAVDDTGMVLGVEDYGIAFDDAAYTQNYAASMPGTPGPLIGESPSFGPLSGGTTSGSFGSAFSLTPDVWYGANRGTATLGSANTLTITSPPGSAPGPVNIKMLFPDGIEVFDPLFFSYGPYLQYAPISGAAPQGGVAASVVGYGMPGDNVTGTLTIGNSTATLGAASGLTFPATLFPEKLLGYTAPAGAPGWADVTVTTPDGTSTLPKAFFYASSVADYASTDQFAAVLYDQKRQQVYLSAGDHIDVFSVATNRFTTPLNPPSSTAGGPKQFSGLALTPDGSLLLAANLLDGSLAAINPDTPTANYAIPIAAVGTNGNPGCNVGPLYVAAIVNSQALVVTGGLPALGCGPGGSLYIVNLTNHAVSPFSGASEISATHNGTKVAANGPLGGLTSGSFCIYDAVAKTSSCNNAYQNYGAEMSGDGQIAASQYVFTDSAANVIGRVAQPDIYYAALNTGQVFHLLEPRLNDAGSLYYIAYPNFFDIVDVRHGILRLRFSLNETILNTAAPMALDSAGRSIFLITNQGLTVVDFGQAPLSIGWLNPAIAPANVTSQVTVRGSGFDSSTTAMVDGQAASLTLVDENTLTLTLPSLPAGPATIVLTNGDGTTYSEPTLLTIQ
jgi:hypothetical protein